MAPDTRERILQTTQHLYSTMTYDEISTTRIIKETGISRGSLYWHFKEKAEIFDAVFLACFEKTVEAARQAYDPAATVIFNLKERLKCLIDFDRKNPDCLPIIAKHVPHIAIDKEKPFPYGSFEEDIRRFAQTGLRNGELADFPVDFLARIISVIETETIDYMHDNPEYYENDAFIEKMIDKLLSAIQA